MILIRQILRIIVRVTCNNDVSVVSTKIVLSTIATNVMTGQSAVVDRVLGQSLAVMSDE